MPEERPATRVRPDYSRDQCESEAGWFRLRLK